MKSDRKQTILFIIILLVLGMGIGYAFLTTTLTIDGVSDIDSASWDVYWSGLEEINSIIDSTQIITHASIGSDRTSVSYHIKLLEPGAQYGFSVYAVNDGSLAARIDNISIRVNGAESSLPNCLFYELGYYYSQEGVKLPVSVGDYLFPNQRREMVFFIAYDENVDPNDLPSENQSLDFSIDIDYTQVSGGRFLYTVSRYGANLLPDEVIPNSVITYNNYQSAMNEIGYDFFIRLYTINDVPAGYSIGFAYNGDIYYLDGADGGAAYNKNKALLLSIFGSNNCSYNSIYNYYGCSDAVNDRVYNVYLNGRVDVGLYSENYFCHIERVGNKKEFFCAPIID